MVLNDEIPDGVQAISTIHKEISEMDYKFFGRTGVKVSPLCLGTMNFGSRTEEGEATKIIDSAIDNGVNFIDTANRYGDAKEGAGRSEEIVGKALRLNGKRDRIFLATKVFFHMYPDDPNGGGLSRRHLISEVEKSLQRLKTDYIDLYQLHRFMPEIPIDETLRALDDLIRSGKVRYIGTSSFPAWQIVEALWVSKELGLNRFVSEQPAYNMIVRTIERNLVSMAQKFNIALIPYSPLMGGLLTDKYHRDADYPKDSRFTFSKWEGIWDGYVYDKTWDLVELVRTIAAEKSCTTSQFALAWTFQQPGITSVIIGPRTEKQLVDNLGCLDVEVNDEDRHRIDGLSHPRGRLLRR
jgi:aryl-alcohol dehydrogenase-like predicted oxidoreductase